MKQSTTKVQKWGNSLAVRLPAASIKRLRIKAGHPVYIVPGPDTDELRIVAAREEPKTLRGLVARITPQNRHGEVSWGPAVGKDVW